LQVAVDGLSFRLSHGGESVPVRLPVVSRVMVGNALLAAAVGAECGLTLDEIARGLEAVQLPGARMRVVTARGAWIINDAYNANPDSMKAALVALSEFPGASRRLAVLGSMGELGQHAVELHHAIGEFAARQDLAFLIAVGPHAKAYAKGALAAGLGHGQIVAALDAEEAAIALETLLREGDVVLVKGSHFMGLERLVADVAGKDAP
jgi:UDP-N-acetylmuramoyl-tripeptide--D-alanyl-D-alanine ligase